MLKIKDNVELNELVNQLNDKYNFLEVYEGKDYYLLTTDRDTYMDIDWKGKRFKTTNETNWQIWKEDRHIRYMSYNKPGVEFVSYSMCEEFDFIYDLIKADLVEKVEE